MNDLLDPPPIEAAAPAEPKADLQPLDLRKINLTDVALAQYGDWQKDVAATKANLSTLVLDLSTPSKIKEARSLRQRLIGEPLAAVRKVAAGIKSAMATTSKAVGAELERIEAAYSEADALILPKIEAREAELEAERAEKARLEAERVAKLQAGIATIRGYVQRAAGLPAFRIANGITQLEAMAFPLEKWQEFAGQAAAARDETLEALRRMHAAAVQAEADRAERERLEAEAARLREQAAERERAEAARLAAIREAEDKAAAEAFKALAEAKRADVEVPPSLERAMVEVAANMVIERAATVTTPDGTVADASTGEILEPIRPDDPGAEPALTPEPERQDVQDAVGVAEVNPQPGNDAAFGRSNIDTPEYRAEQEALNARARAMLEAAAADTPAVKLGDLCDRLSRDVAGGFKLTEAMVVSLGITPRRDGRAVLIAESALPDLADKLVERIREVLG